MFVNLGNNSRLDIEGFAPSGEVVTSMVIVERVLELLREVCLLVRRDRESLAIHVLVGGRGAEKFRHAGSSDVSVRVAPGLDGVEPAHLRHTQRGVQLAEPEVEPQPLMRQPLPDLAA